MIKNHLDRGIDFLSKECKSKSHESCHSRWTGLGFEFTCDCTCHNKKEMVLELVGEPVANTIKRIQPITEVDS